MEFGNMWTHLITLLVGFAAGCKIRDLLGEDRINGFWNSSKSKFSPHVKFSTPANEASTYTTNCTNSRPSGSRGFSLQSIRHIFNENNVELINAGSFNILLREIRNHSYKSILRNIVENATSPDKLVHLLQNEVTPSFMVNIKPAEGAPYIETSKLDEYIYQEKINPSDVGDTADKVKFLLTLSHTRGIEDFKKTLGPYFTDIIKHANSNDDVSEMYVEIMKIVRNRYEFMN